MGTIFHIDEAYSGAPSTWGQINGTLSNQSDLNTALSAKKNVDDSDSWTDAVTQANGVAVFDNLNPNYGYHIEYVIPSNGTSISVPKWTNLKQENGTTTGTIKQTYTISGGTNGTSQFKLRIEK